MNSVGSARGRDIQRRRIAHGIRSINQFAEVVPHSRATIARAEGGLGSPEVLESLERFLDERDAEAGMDTRHGPAVADLAEELDEDMISVEITGPSMRSDYHIVFRSRPEHADLITEQAARLLRQMESDSQDS